MRILLLVALVISATMAGCADRADALSARDGLAPAHEAARAHGDAPVLVNIASIEPFKHMAEDDFEVWVHLDKDPGDGLAPAWMYTFASGDRLIGILYAAGLGVIAEGYEIGEGASTTPLGDWILDSTDVARALAQHEGWPAASDDTTVFWSLEQDEGPLWSVEWHNATATSRAIVDARTGNVTQIESRQSAWTDFCTQSFQTGGLIHPAQGVSQSIDVSGGLLQYAYGWDMTVGQATMTLTGPDGELERKTLADSGQDEGAVEVEAGTYTLEITSDLGLGQISFMSLSACQ